MHRLIDANKSKMVGNFDLAMDRFEQVLSKDKKNHAAMYELAKLHALKKNDEKAMRYIKSALNLAPGNTWYNSMLADILVHQSDYTAASKVYDQLIKNDPENDDLYFEQAYLFAFAKDNRPDEAIRIYNMLEGKMGVNPEISKQKYDLYMRSDQSKKGLEHISSCLPNIMSAWARKKKHRKFIKKYLR